MSGWVSVAVLPLLTECTGTVVAAAAIHAIHLEHPLRVHVPACSICICFAIAPNEWLGECDWPGTLASLQALHAGCAGNVAATCSKDTDRLVGLAIGFAAQQTKYVDNLTQYASQLQKDHQHYVW